MTVLFVTRSIPLHPSSGGMEEVAWQLAKAINTSEPVEVLTTSVPGRSNDFVSEGIRVFAIADTLPGRYSPRWWLKTARWNTDRKYRSVLSVSAGATTMVWFSPGSKYVFQAHGTAASELASIIRGQPRLWALKALRMWLWSMIDRLTYARVDAVVAVSPTVEAKLRSLSRGGLWIRTRLEVIENGVDTSLIEGSLVDRSAARRDYGLDEDKFLALTVSRLVRQKGVDRAVDATAMSGTHCNLLVVGDGPEEAGLRKLAEDLGVRDRVHFAGRLDSPGVRRALSAADAFVFPVRDAQREGLPMAVLEALAAGLPVIVPAESEWHPELVPLLTFADVNDPSSLADAFSRAVDAPKQGLPRSFTTAKMSSAYLRVFAGV